MADVDPWWWQGASWEWLRTVDAVALAVGVVVSSRGSSLAVGGRFPPRVAWWSAVGCVALVWGAGMTYAAYAVAAGLVVLLLDVVVVGVSSWWQRRR